MVNAGIPGARLEQSLINLKQRVLPLSPDVVVVYHANNDMARDTQVLAASEGLDVAKRRSPGPIEFLSKYSMLVDLAYKNLAISNQSNTEKLSSVPQDIANGFGDQLREFVETAHNADAQVVLSHFITKYRSDQSLDEQTKNADVAFYYMPWMKAEHFASTINSYNQEISDVAASTEAPIVKDVDSIPADSQHFKDCMHFADAGCEKMAMRFADFLSSSGMIDKIEQGQPSAFTSISPSSAERIVSSQP